MDAQEKHLYAFGPFQVDSVNRFLLRDGRPLPLTPKAFDILLLLVEHHGQLLEKDRIMQVVWPDTFVEEGNLTQHISTLRRILGETPDRHEYIDTIPRRGYRFVAPITVVSPAPDVLVVHERTRSRVMIEEETSEGFAPPALPAVRRSLRMSLLLGLLALLMLSGAGLFYWYTSSRPALPFAKRDWILILDFENQTGDPRFDRALLTAFTVSLEQSRYVNVYSRARAGSALQRMGRPVNTPLDEPLGIEVARRDALRAVIAPNITRAGQQFAITARLVDPRRQLTVRSFTRRANDENQILDALEALAKDVRQGLGESLFAISQAGKPLLQVTTHSLPALQAYVEGSVAWHRGQYNDALKNYQRALELDPDFAMAHADLASALASHIYSDPKGSRAHYEKALQLLDRTTERERLFIEGRFKASLGHHEEVVSAYDSFLAVYPDDPIAHFNRAWSLMRLRRYDDAISGFEQVLRINSTDANALINIATCLNSQDKDREALPYYQRAFALEPAWVTTANLNHEYGFALVGAGEIAKAREAFSLALAKPDSKPRALRSLALLDLYLGHHHDAAEKLRQATTLSPDPEGALARARNHLFLSILREEQGDPAAALRELDAARKDLTHAQPVPWLALRVGAAYARLNSPDAAAKILEGNRAKVDPKDLDTLGEMHRLEGELEFTRGNRARALELLELAARERPDALAAESLARVRAADPAQAVAAWEKLLSQPSWLGWEPQQAHLNAQVELARAYLVRGEKEKARKLLDTTLTLWNEADPDIPVFRVAKAEYAKLK